jgi:aminopeptidase N
VRAFAAVATDPPALQGLLDGSAVPEGLAMDTDLRWTVLKALARIGAVDEAVVDEELARDTTAAGMRSALTARASLPDEAVKARTWAQAVSAEGMSNHEVHALAGGFWQPGQDALLQPYVARFVADLPGMWARLSPEVVGRLTALLFPSTLVSQEVLDATAPLLDAQHPAGLRRYVAEERDDLARALRARALR